MKEAFSLGRQSGTVVPNPFILGDIHRHMLGPRYGARRGLAASSTPIGATLASSRCQRGPADLDSYEAGPVARELAFKGCSTD